MQLVILIETCIIYDLPRPFYLSKATDKSKIIKPKATKATNENQKKIQKLK